jgi:hypothetical protein
MSVSIETTEDLLTLLKKLKVTVANVEDLRGLLASINASYNPQAARVRTAKLVALSVPCGLGAIAGFVSMLLTTASLDAAYFVGALALVWGSCALVSVTALVFSFTLLLGRQARSTGDMASASKPSALEERITTELRHDLSV